MSCAPGQPCEEGMKRRRALIVLALMAILFLGLSVASFLPERVQAIPQKIHYGDYDAVAGKRIFQAYNCMGCHTLVGNGAYLGPDLTQTYAHVGPAWLEAFLPSAGAWPTETAVKLQLQNARVAQDAGVDDIDAYFAKFPGTADRVSRRTGHKTLMPNLPLSRDEVQKLIAFLKYTSAMNTEGWPPKPRVDAVALIAAKQAPAHPAMPASGAESADEAAGANTGPASGPTSGAASGAQLAEDNGCMACHSAGKDVLVGPGWAGLYDAQVTFTDGSKLRADDAYLAQSITDPDAHIVKGFESGVMPPYAGMLDTDQVDAIVAYIRSLGEK